MVSTQELPARRGADSYGVAPSLRAGVLSCGAVLLVMISPEAVVDARHLGVLYSGHWMSVETNMDIDRLIDFLRELIAHLSNNEMGIFKFMVDNDILQFSMGSEASELVMYTPDIYDEQGMIELSASVVADNRYFLDLFINTFSEIIYKRHL